MRINLLALSMLLLPVLTSVAPRPYDLQGHRGCRGLMPENTIPAFLKALELGVNTLELDVVISQDRQVVVSHDPYINADFSLKPDGTPVIKSEQKELVIYQMPYTTVSQYDVGLRGNPRFPAQQKLAVHKPLLRDMLVAAEQYRINHKQLPHHYNIELKSEESEYDISQPRPDNFCQLVNDVLTQAGIPADRLTIQSFDFAILKAWHQRAAAGTLLSVRLSALVENMRGIDYNLKKLGFTPAVYSPNFHLLNQKGIEKLHKMGIQVIPWTINDVPDMNRLLRMGVDGLITDYPDRAKGL